MADRVALAEVLGANGGLGHQMTSANVPSSLRKYAAPPAVRTTTTAADTRGMTPGAGPPASAHLKPSMTPAIGLRPYTARHRAGTSDAGYATGVANIQS